MSKCPHCSFDPKPEAMADRRMDDPHAAPAIASGFGLNGAAAGRNQKCAQDDNNLQSSRTIRVLAAAMTSHRKTRNRTNDDQLAEIYRSYEGP